MFEEQWRMSSFICDYGRPPRLAEGDYRTEDEAPKCATTKASWIDDDARHAVQMPSNNSRSIAVVAAVVSRCRSLITRWMNLDSTNEVCHDERYKYTHGMMESRFLSLNDSRHCQHMEVAILKCCGTLVAAFTPWWG